MKYLRWLMWVLWYLPQRDPKDLPSFMVRLARTRRPGQQFKPSVYYNEIGKFWEIWFSDAACAFSLRTLRVDVGYSDQDGRMAALQIPENPTEAVSSAGVLWRKGPQLAPCRPFVNGPCLLAINIDGPLTAPRLVTVTSAVRGNGMLEQALCWTWADVWWWLPLNELVPPLTSRVDMLDR